MFDKSDLVKCNLKDLDGKVLELHCAYEKPLDADFGYYCLYGWENGTEIKYLIAIERLVEND